MNKKNNSLTKDVHRHILCLRSVLIVKWKGQIITFLRYYLFVAKIQRSSL